MSTPAPAHMGAGAMWAMLDNLSQQVLSFGVFLVLARLVSPSEFGLIAIAHVLVALVRQTVLDAIVHPVARSPEPSDALYSWAFGLCLLAAGLMAALMLAGADLAARFYAQAELARVLSWMSLAVLATGAAAVYEVRLIRRMAFRPLAIRSMVSVTLGGSVGIILALRGAGVMALVMQQLVTSGLALVLLVAQSHWWPRLRWRGPAPANFVPDASRVGLTGLFGFLASQGDTLLVSIFMGSHATGIYSFAKRLTSAIYLVIGSSLLKLAIPAFAGASSHPQALCEAYVRLLGTTVFLMAPLLAGLSVLALPTITLFFGAVWAPAAPIVALLSLLYLLLAANQINDYLLFAVGARSVPMQRSLLQIVLAMGLGWLCSGRGLAWTAAGFVAASTLVWPWAQALANQHMGLSFGRLARNLKSPLLATLTMALFLWLALQTLALTLVSLILLVLGGASVFLLAHALVTRAWPASHNALVDLLQMRRRGAG